jgi:hypothetical protein
VFHLIAEWQNIDILMAVLPYASSSLIDKGNLFGVTPLHIACGARFMNEREEQFVVNVDFLDWFLMCKLCDKNKKDKDGLTAMHYACCNLDIVVIEKLLELHNVIIDLYDKDDETPLHQLFNKIYVDGDKRALTLSLKSALSVLNIFQATGVQVNYKNKNGFSIIDKAFNLKNSLALQHRFFSERADSEIDKEHMNIMNSILEILYSFESKKRQKQYYYFLDDWYVDN